MDYFDSILLAFNYKAAIEGEQQLTRFRRTLTRSPWGRIRMLPESGSLCHVGFDAGNRIGKFAEETGRDEEAREREKETAKDRRTQTPRKPGRRELDRNNYRSKSWHAASYSCGGGSSRTTHEEFHYKSQVGRSARGGTETPRGPA